MSAPPHARPARIVSARDPDFSVRVAEFDDLVGLQREAEELGLSARWSSRAALERQVAPGTTVILAPALRHTLESYRCFIWFVPRAADHASAVSLFDVTVTSFDALREVTDPARLRMVVHMLLDRMPLSPIE
ncbi:hypothetical protein [Dactylosporangium sp. CS-033363]|uniref:hypothetical protein n=1 Tax=Dactylosporangium sp. CS-033363 TaxID=3239935 RepID=UPI003D91F253